MYISFFMASVLKYFNEKHFPVNEIWSPLSPSVQGVYRSHLRTLNHSHRDTFQNSVLRSTVWYKLFVEKPCIFRPFLSFTSEKHIHCYIIIIIIIIIIMPSVTDYIADFFS
jgi:hypothetical protein